MKSLSDILGDDLIEKLRAKTARGDFPGIDFKTAMTFLLSDGVIPRSGLPVDSFVRLEDWARDFSQQGLSFTATELKNKTGVVLEHVIAGKTVTIFKHGRPVAQITPTGKR